MKKGLTNTLFFCWRRLKIELLLLLVSIILFLTIDAHKLFFFNHSLNSGFKEFYNIEMLEKKDELSFLSLKNDKSFFIHTGKNLPTNIKIKIIKEGEYSLKIGVQKMTGTGCINNINAGIIDVSYSINNLQQDSFYIDRNIEKEFPLNLKVDDILELKYYNHGGYTACDWGLLMLTPKYFKSDSLKLTILILSLLLFLIPFIWLKWYYSTLNSSFIIFIFGFSEFLTHNYIQLPSILFTILIAITFTIIIKTLSSIMGKKTLVLLPLLITFIIIITPPILNIVHTLIYNKTLSSITLHAIFQTNLQEVLEFCTKLNSTNYLIILLILLVEGTIILLSIKKEANSIPNLVLMVIGLSLLLCIYKSFNHNRILSFISTSFLNYQEELSLLKKEISLRKINSNFQATHFNKNETYVLIIGESQNKNHLSIYGYPRNTTPFLKNLEKNNDIIKFENAFSTHTHTIGVVPFSITSAIKSNNDSVNLSPSILEVFNNAGFDTYWISNQNQAGVWDNPITVIANTAKYKYYINKTVGATSESRTYDHQLLPFFDKALTNPHKKLIILHLIGSHYNYYSRYPERFNHFPSTIPTDTFGIQSYNSCNQNEIMEYDNSINYFDSNIEHIITQLQKQKSVSSLIYFSDHADDSDNCTGHNWEQFSWSMTQIGSFIWNSKSYNDRYPNINSNLKKNRSKYFPNDRIFNATVGLAQIETNLNLKEYDISSNIYKSSNNLKVSNKNYRNKENPFYNLNENINYLKDSTELLKTNVLLTHRSNSIGKTLWSQYYGIHNFELDLTFNEDSLFFDVGHGIHELNKYNFEELLTKIPLDSINKIWLDIKNITTTNLSQILTRLNYLDNKFKLQKRVIVESSLEHQSMAKIAETGFHTSYYLPTEKIFNIERTKKKELTKSLLSTIKNCKYSAISYDIRLSDFVISNLNDHLSTNIHQHVWILNTHLTSSDFKTNLQPYLTKKFDRIKTILIPWKTQFDF